MFKNITIPLLKAFVKVFITIECQNAMTCAAIEKALSLNQSNIR